MQHDFSQILETNSPYWERVQEIYAKNEDLPKKIISGRNLHHKFPRSFSKILKEPADNEPDNLVSLSVSEHVLVHYYYYLLAKKGYRGPMASAFRYMVRNCMKFITPETMELIARDYEEAKPISDMYQSEIIKERWENGIYKNIFKDRDFKAISEKALNTFMKRPEEERKHINYNRGKSLRGKTYEEAYGAEKAAELKMKRAESNKHRDYTKFKKCKPTVLVKCIETGEVRYMGEWIKTLGCKSKSSICNVLDNPDKTCRKLHFVRYGENGEAEWQERRKTLTISTTTGSRR